MIYAINKRTKEHRLYERGDECEPEVWEIINSDAKGWIPWHDGKCPLPEWQSCEIRFRDGHTQRASVPGDYRWSPANGESEFPEVDIVAYRPILGASEEVTAPDVLWAAVGHMEDRASTYDSPKGERSMAATVGAFKEVTGVELSEEQGWLFMTLLKVARSQKGDFKLDNYEDGAAYFGLMAEAAAKERG